MTRLALPALLLVASTAFAQGPIRPIASSKVKPLTGDAPGYTKQIIEGFSVHVSKEAATADASGFERKPADVLGHELKSVAKALPKRHLDFAKSLPVWVEWDEKMPLPGNMGFASAAYFGGPQAVLLPEGRDSPKFRTVTVLSLSRLTALHQPQNDYAGSVLLHEFAHAVHDQQVGRDGIANITAAYKQAMERKLYEKSLYACANEAEFFAEISCAYFDRLPYFPRNRAELKKLDPVSFKMLDAIWASPTRPDAPAILPENGAKKFDLTVTLADIALGEVLAGKPLLEEDAIGRVVVVLFWHPNDVTVLTRAGQVVEELRGFGVRVVVASKEELPDPKKPRAEMERRDVTFTAVASALITERKKEMLTSPPMSHALVFDQSGACIFRGNGHDASAHARLAVTRKLFADFVKPKSKDFTRVADALANGEPFSEVLAVTTPLLASTDPELTAAAKTVQSAILAPVAESLAAAQKLRKADPLAAFLAAEKIAVKAKGTPPAAKALELVGELKAETVVTNELKARKLFEPIARLDQTLSGLPGSFEPTAGKFQIENSTAIQNLRTAVEKLKKQYPSAKITAEAERIAAVYGLR